MYAPITSEVILERGLVLKEIATEQQFRVAERVVPDAPVAGEEAWRLEPIGPDGAVRKALVLPRQMLSERFVADVGEDEGL